MSKQLEEITVTEGSPHTFGWQRRPELDTETGKAWEQPDGKIWLHPRNAPDPLFFRMKREGPFLRDKSGGTNGREG